jgi:dUTP pyrophosphatase
MKVNILLDSPKAKIPDYETPGAAGVDMTCVSRKKIKGGLFPLYEYDTGIIMEIPRGYFALLCARSSVSKLLMWLANGVGIVDSDYRGTIRFRFRSIFGLGKYNVGDRVGQSILMKRNKFDFNLVAKVSSSQRGDGGFGSTGK